jgi:hypothetical protein
MDLSLSLAAIFRPIFAFISLFVSVISVFSTSFAPYFVFGSVSPGS